MVSIDVFMNNTNNVESILENKKIDIKKDKNYVLLKYDIFANFSDAIVQQCRGIIYKKENNQYICVCRPFDKFFNYQETNAVEIDWPSAKVQEKIDGSIIKLWYDNYRWNWSTNGVINAFESDVNEFMTFGDLILKADNYKDIDFDALDKDYTYMFELISPYNKVVIEYNKIHLYHIGTRNNITGEEIHTDIGIEKPKEYKLNSLDDCIKAVEAMNDDTMDQEGFVVVDKYFNRIKIKSPKYFMYHRMWNNGAISPKRVIGIIKEGNMNDAMEHFPVLIEDILKYNAAMAVFRYKAQKIINEARSTYAEFDNDRRAASQVINTFEYPSIGYWSIDHEGNVDDFINSMKENNYIRTIETEVNKL